MRVLTDHVDPNEPCWAYFCGPMNRNGYSEDENPRMVEEVFVIREGGNAIARYEQDFGPADDYGYVPPLKMPCFGEENVGFMQWMGEQHRHDARWSKLIQEYKESSTLFADIIRQEEQRHLAIENRSSLGPYVNVQRNGWSRERVRRNYKDALREKTGKVKFLT